MRDMRDHSLIRCRQRFKKLATAFIGAFTRQGKRAGNDNGCLNQNQPVPSPPIEKGRYRLSGQSATCLPLVFSIAATVFCALPVLATEPSHNITRTTPAGSSPLLQSAQRLSCSSSETQAREALEAIENNLAPGWQLPNEWHGSARTPELYAASLDIVIAQLIEAAYAYPELQPRIDHLLLSWNYCHVLGRNYFQNLLATEDGSTAAPDVSLAAREAPLNWSGFASLGILPPWHITPGLNQAVPERYLPPLLESPRQTPLFKENRVWKVYARHCYPHPADGLQMLRKRAFGPTRLDLDSPTDEQLIGYPLSWDDTCSSAPPEPSTPEEVPSSTPAEKPASTPATTLATAPTTTVADEITPALAAAEPEQSNQHKDADQHATQADMRADMATNDAHDNPAQSHTDRLASAKVEDLSDDKSESSLTTTIKPISESLHSSEDWLSYRFQKKKRVDPIKSRLIRQSRGTQTKQADELTQLLQVVKATNKDTDSGSADPRADSFAVYLENKVVDLALAQKEQSKRTSRASVARVHLSRQLRDSRKPRDGRLGTPTVTRYLTYRDRQKRDRAILEFESGKRITSARSKRVQLSRRLQVAIKASREEHKSNSTVLSASDIFTDDVIHNQEASSRYYREKARRLSAIKVLRVQHSRLTDKTPASDWLPTQTPVHTIAVPILRVSKTNPATTFQLELSVKPGIEPRVTPAHSQQLKVTSKTLELGKLITAGTIRVLTLPLPKSRPDLLASTRQTKEKQLNPEKVSRVQVSRRYAQGATNVPVLLTLSATPGVETRRYRAELAKRLGPVKIRRVQVSRNYWTHALASENHGSDGWFPSGGAAGVDLSAWGRFNQWLRRVRAARSKYDNRDTGKGNVDNIIKTQIPQRRRALQPPLMSRSRAWRVILSREYASRTSSPGWRSAFEYFVPSSQTPNARMSKRRHQRRIWGDKGLDAILAALHKPGTDAAITTAASSAAITNGSTGFMTFPGSALPGTTGGTTELGDSPENNAATQSLGTAGSVPGGTVSPVTNAPPYPSESANKGYGFSGTLSLNNTQLEFGDEDHYSVTSLVAYKPVKSSYWFLRSGITLNNSDEPVSYTWGLGYDDWHPGSWGFEINNWNPLKPGDGLDLDNAIASLSHKFKSNKLKDRNLGSSLSLNKGVNSEFALTWLVSWAPRENWFIRSLLTQPLEGGELSWAYGFGYNNWRKKTWSLEYNNWGYNKAFDTNFKQNAIVTLSYKWEW